MSTSTGGNLSAATTNFATKGTVNGVALVILGPPNPPWGEPGQASPPGYEAQQTNLYWANNTVGAWSSFIYGAMNRFPIDPQNAVNLNWPPAVVSWGAWRLDFFVGGDDGSLWHTWIDHAVNGHWEFLGYPTAGKEIANVQTHTAPAVVSRGANMLDIFVLGDDQNLWYLEWNNGWKPWVNLGVPPLAPNGLSSMPVAIAESATDLVVFATVYGAVWEIECSSGNWKPWSSLGAPTPGIQPYPPPPTVVTDTPPCALALGGNQRLVFVRGIDNSCWYRAYLSPSSGAAPQWGAWAQLIGPGNLASLPSAIIASGYAHLFAVSYAPYEAGSLLHMRMGYTVEPNHAIVPQWTALEVIPSTTPLISNQLCLASGGENALDVFGVDAKGMIHHFWSNTTDETNVSDWKNETLTEIVVQPFVTPGS